jgi:nicotinate dehydrogenase subunit B
VPLEPRAAVAQWDGDTVTIRCGVQAPFLVRQEVAQALNVPEAQVRIIAMDSGGGFGGKQRGECEVEAARLARLAGAPVRVAWTREEEFTCSYTRPAGLLEIESGVDADGRLTAMRFANYNSGAAGITPPYEIPHHWIGFYRTRSDVRQGSYRSLAAVANAFARESHMDEWAADLRVDPGGVPPAPHDRRAAARGDRAHRGALRLGPGDERRGRGRHELQLEKDARLALFVEVEVDGTRVRVVRMVATGDFGAALNPDTLRNQMTGALIQGIGGALWEQRDLRRHARRRRAGCPHYRVPRFSDVPAMDVQIIDRRDVPSAGAGESPITLTAPALAAAVYAATGVRRRELPLMHPVWWLAPQPRPVSPS